MGQIVRGALWFGLYLFLVLLPLTTAVLANPNRTSPSPLVAIAVGAGFVGYSVMALEFALISRIKGAASAFGEDSLQLFHNLMGMVALGLILLHPLLLILGGYPAECWLNPFSACANGATITASLSLYVLILLIVTSVWRKQLQLRYEIWNALHGLFALFVVIASLGHIFILGRYSSSRSMDIVWIIYAVLVSFIIIWYRILKPILHWDHKWKVVENRIERGDARTLVLEPVGHTGFTFQPGQFAWLKLGRTPFGIGQHPISLSSNAEIEQGESIAFTIKNLGDWSGDEVPALMPGEEIWVDGPHGVFSIDREQGMGYVLIGGGVGITPLYSMLQTLAAREDVRPVYLFYGGSDWESLTFREELDELTQQMNLQVVYVQSKPDEDWTGETGYVSGDVLSRYLPKQYKRFVYLICGPPPLMDAMERDLPELGVHWEHVHTERFDMA